MASTFREERNAKARERLARSLPSLFPPEVIAHAHARPLIPPTPRLAIESYWRHHPIRADRLARALATRAGHPQGWTWRLGSDKASGLPLTFRTPPAPFREAARTLGPGHCRVCGGPVFRLGWHRDLWGDGVLNRRAEWHAGCVTAWKLWTAPSDFVAPLAKLQQRRCAASGKRLLKTAEVDHRTPLFRVWRDFRDAPWPDLLGYWGAPNLQVINRAAHVEKCGDEAAERSAFGRGADDAPAA
ncbi:hypothetical protein SLNSH_07505 [Alsobacter soli]|uniref:Uncharacterized protein n=1 Tax=Alsobacter soli TaxID=2109933 RepID=A0A2T1HVY0_9HYPH|nr:hypothetical protein [Alsobacter soli]PSC05813.1 hypothetical protein SLNSH_07505 [Alsobacter soli]